MINYFDFENHKADMIDTQLRILLKVDIITAILSKKFIFLMKDPCIALCTGLLIAYVPRWFLFNTVICVLSKKALCTINPVYEYVLFE
jgi:hypothetical protein